MIDEGPSYEYRVVPVETIGRLDTVQTVIDRYSSDHWRLVETIQADGCTTALIFERMRPV